MTIVVETDFFWRKGTVEIYKINDHFGAEVAISETWDDFRFVPRVAFERWILSVS